MQSVCKAISQSNNKVVISEIKTGLQQQGMTLGAAQPNSVVLNDGSGVAMLPFRHFKQCDPPYYHLSQLSQSIAESVWLWVR